MKNSVENIIFYTRDLCPCALDTDSLRAENVRRNEEYYESDSTGRFKYY